MEEEFVSNKEYDEIEISKYGKRTKKNNEKINSNI